MVEVHFDGKYFQLNRVIAEIKSDHKKSIIVFIGGMHGNEPTGAIALKKVFDELKPLNLDWLGDVYAFSGNLQALSASKRFIDHDLNRAWSPSQVLKAKEKSLEKTIAETEEQYALYDLIWPLLKEEVPIYFIDLHTTSSASTPFITINDIMTNRDYSLLFPSPIIMGIEEYIAGPLLSYMNNLETVSLAFEAGQHQDTASLENHISFIYLALVNAGVLRKEQLPAHSFHLQRLEKRAKDVSGIYEIRYKKHIHSSDQFKMKPGYSSFDDIQLGEVVATDIQGAVKTPEKGKIFMPLYQNQGSDGYFIIRKVPKWAMVLSRFFRKIHMDRLLTILPGVSRDPNNKNSILVNNRIALYLAKDLFHLLGYRRKKEVDKTMYFSRREID